jgi:CTP:phosphocholine cytidylyltransferase-like protein
MMDRRTVRNIESFKTNKFVKLVNVVGFTTKKFVTMHDHTNVKLVFLIHYVTGGNWLIGMVAYFVGLFVVRFFD